MKSLTLILITCVTICKSTAGGFIITKPDNNNQYLLTENAEAASVNITDNKAVVTIQQEFYNASGSRLEGYFIFPVPNNTSIQSFEMDINGKMMTAELLEADKARKIYEDIVRQANDPALLEYVSQDLYKVRIFPIEPHSNKKVKFTYVQLLHKDGGNTFFNLAQHKSPNSKKLQLHINIQTSAELKNVNSPTYPVSIKRESKYTASVVYQNSTHSSTTDFEMFFSTSANKIGCSLLCYKQYEGAGYFMLDINPGWEQQHNSLPKDVTFVLDVSGSMAGEKLHQAQQALKYCINNLTANDRFEIIRFSTEANRCFGQAVNFTPENKNKAISYINELRATGGTNIDEALTLAMQHNERDNRPHFIIFITDGKPTIGETDENRLIKMISSANRNQVRIFTFGIGEDINTHLLDKLTQQTNAYSSYISPTEDIEIKISTFFDKISFPILTNATISFEGQNDLFQIYPKHLPDLFIGGNILAFGRYEHPGKSKLILSGIINQQKVSYTYDLFFSEKNTDNHFITPLWAGRAIGYLLNEIRLHGESDEVKSEIIKIAKKHGIITPYTSYLILEDEPLNSNQEIPAIRDMIKEEFDSVVPDGQHSLSPSINQKSGSGAVRASEAIQNYNQITNKVELAEEQSRQNNFSKGSGTAINNYQNVTTQGKSFYNYNNTWIDTEIENAKELNKITLKFGSEDYFNFIRNNTETAPYFSQGKWVTFIYKEDIISVIE